MSENNQPDGKFIMGFIMGGVIGALTIFFLGTKEGKKTGKLLEEKGKDFVGDLQEKLEELETQGRDLAKKGEEIKEQVAQQIEDKKETLTKEATVKIDSALAHIEALQEHGRDTTASLRKRLFKNAPKK